LTSDAAALTGAVASLSAEGSTNMFDGLELAFGTAAAALSPDRQARVLLVSDGSPTRGDTSAADLEAMATSDASTAISLTTIGIGSDPDDALLRARSARGAGVHYYLDDAASIEDVFGDELATYLTPIGYDLDLRVSAGATFGVSEVLGAPTWTVEDGAG